MYDAENYCLSNNFRVDNLEGVAHKYKPQSIGMKKLGPHF